MKTKKLPVILLAILMVFSVLPIGVSAAQTTVTPTSTASITVQNALENDVLAAYKVIDITYDAGTNTLSYAWNSDFDDYFAGTTSYNTKAYTVEQFAALSSDSDAFKNLLANLPNYISNRKIDNVDAPIAPVATQTVAVDGTATFADLGMGEYFIRPTSTTSVYQLMLQRIEPTVVDGTYVIDDVTFSAKKQEVNITKSANKTSVTKNEKVTYTLTVDIPTYSTNAADKSFYVSDLLPDGLTIDTDSTISVKVNNADVATEAYTLDTTAKTEYTFKLSVSTEQYTSNWSANGGHSLIITYEATLNDNNTTEVNVNETNTAKFDYSYYPYVENSHKQKTDTVDVTTFAIKIDKFAYAEETKKLSGAMFDLYRTATQAEIAAGTAVVIPHTEVEGIMLESGSVTDENGAATFAKYEANGTNYDYYLVETKAPTGYNLLDTPVKVNFTDAEVEATGGVYTVKVPNNSGIMLPITGGMGTVIFTALGIVLMGTALTAYIIFRKKVKAKESR